jgi:hemerythrin
LGKERADLNLEWTPYLAVGVSVIDDQHRELFRRFNRLSHAVMQGEVKEELSNVVKFLEDYVVSHFGMEEEVMDRYSYTGASAHKAQHAQFAADLASFKKQLETSGSSTALAGDMLKRLGEWLLNHVGKSDRELGSFLQVAMRVRKAA